MNIYIRGFKSIRDGQFVAIGNRLTFLVGPNSAGKSVVLSALEKLSGDSAKFKLDINLIHKNPSAQFITYPCHSLGVEWNNGNEKYGVFATYFDDEVAHSVDASIQRNIHQSQLSTTMSSTDESRDLSFRLGIHVNNLLSVGVNNLGNRQYNRVEKIILKRVTLAEDQVFIDVRSVDGKIRKDFDEYMCWTIQLLLDCTTESELKLNGNISANSKKFWLEQAKAISDSTVELKYYYSEDLLLWDLFFLKTAIQIFFSDLRKQQKLNTFEKYNSKIEKYKKSFYKKIKKDYPGQNFQVSVVSAERGLPSLSDTTCHLKTSDDNINIFHELMYSKVQQDWVLSKNHFDKINNMSNLFECVNKALGDSLFTDNGYQIQVESKALIKNELWKERRDLDIELDIDETEFLCKLSLIDSHGRNLSFYDVGSGIGYVLPVLIESFRYANEGKIVFLQQPELHLHPALQTNLTDVLIEASANKRIIAETHSEHMILRALKRVRQTTNGTVKDPTLMLRPEDVAVNYFEPLPDGSTKVHILRISKDGDFLDRWPNGFFEERGRELFDE